MSCFFRCRPLRNKGRRVTKLTYNQTSDIGYCEYFHMSRPNKLHKLRGSKFSRFYNVSDESKYRFFRCSDWPKMRVKYGWHLFDNIEKNSRRYEYE